VLEDPELPTVNIDTRLNYRWLDTRTPANQAIFRIQSAVSMLFREVRNIRVGGGNSSKKPCVWLAGLKRIDML